MGRFWNHEFLMATQIFLEFSPRNLGKWSHFDSYFSNGVGSTTNRIKFVSGSWKMIWPTTPIVQGSLASFLIDIACVRLREDGFGLQICTPRETGCGCVPNLGSLKSSTGTNTTYPTKINIRWHKSIISGNLDVWFGHLPNFERFAMLLFSADPVLTAASLKTWLHWIRETTFGSKIGGLEIEDSQQQHLKILWFRTTSPNKTDVWEHIFVVTDYVGHFFSRKS